MEAALTFGSVGDIIAICQVANQLRRALSDSRGSAKDYQDLRRELDAFIQILTHVADSYESYNDAPWARGLDQATRSAVEECSSLIKDTLHRIQPRYAEYLSLGMSQGKVKDASRRVEWLLREQRQVRDLQDKLRANTMKLTLLETLAMRKAHKVHHEALLGHISKVDVYIRETEARDDNMLQLLRDQNSSQDLQQQQLRSVDAKLERQAQENSGHRVEVKHMLDELSETIGGLRLSAEASFFVHSLDPTKELPPVILIDSLGRTLPMHTHLVAIMKWEILDMILASQFERSKGHAKVQGLEYKLEEGASGRALDRRIPLSASLRPGMKLYMTMVFKDFNYGTVLSGSCPRCRLKTEAPEGNMVQCVADGCGMAFKLESRCGWFDPVHPDRKMGMVQDTQVDPTTKTAIVPADFQRVTISHVKNMKWSSEHNRRRRRRKYTFWYCCSCGLGPMNWHDEDRCWGCSHFNCTKYNQSGYPGCSETTSFIYEGRPPKAAGAVYVDSEPSEVAA